MCKTVSHVFKYNLKLFLTIFKKNVYSLLHTRWLGMSIRSNLK